MTDELRKMLDDARRELPQRLETLASMIELGERIHFGSISGLMREAAAELTALREELKWSKREAEQAHEMVDALRAKVKRQAEALKPFAACPETLIMDRPEYRESDVIGCSVTIRDLRRAAQEATDE